MSEFGKSKAALKSAKVAKKRITVKTNQVRVVTQPALDPLESVKIQINSLNKKITLKNQTLRDVKSVPTIKQLDKSLTSGTILKLETFKKGVKL